ncbi:hypothetical protein ACWGEU_36905 [Streptomyces goshikiensis]
MDDLSADVRVLMVVVGWQPQTQRFMAEVAGIPGPGSATGERFTLVGFRRLIEQRAQAARDLADFDAGWLPRVWRGREPPLRLLLAAGTVECP